MTAATTRTRCIGGGGHAWRAWGADGAECVRCHVVTGPVRSRDGSGASDTDGRRRAVRGADRRTGPLGAVSGRTGDV